MTDWMKDPEIWRAWRQLPSGGYAMAVVCRNHFDHGQRWVWEVRSSAGRVTSGEAPWVLEAKDRAAAALEALS
jgi:hypothetical protein